MRMDFDTAALPNIHVFQERLEKRRRDQTEHERDRSEKLRKQNEKQSGDRHDAAMIMVAVHEMSYDPVELSARLDAHQIALIEALIANQEALDVIQARLDVLLAVAHMLEDGRRVFKTRDGRQVIDEFGQEIDIDPETVPDALPIWEDYEADLMDKANLMAQRAELLEYQSELDAAQDKLESGDFDQADLRALDDLMNDAPAAMRAYLPDTDPAAMLPDQPAQDTGLDQTSLDDLPFDQKFGQIGL